MDNEFNTISKFQETINRDNANKHYSGEGSIYFGESNAFAIQLFCIEDKYDSRFYYYYLFKIKREFGILITKNDETSFQIDGFFTESFRGIS